MMRMLFASVVVTALATGLAASVSMPAEAAETGHGFPFRGADRHCVVVDQRPRHAKGDHRWFVSVLARYGGREDGCRVVRMVRYGQALTWHVALTCPNGPDSTGPDSTGPAREDWTLNFDGSITADRGGRKSNFRVCNGDESR